MDGRLVAIPSVPAADYPEETRPALLEAHELILDLLQDAGVEELDSRRLPKTAPFITVEIAAPPVLPYGHYDVAPSGDDSKRESPAFEPTVRDGAMFGRGAADSKSTVLAHVGALRAWDGRPSLGIRLVIKGQEEGFVRGRARRLRETAPDGRRRRLRGVVPHARRDPGQPHGAGAGGYRFGD